MRRSGAVCGSALAGRSFCGGNFQTYWPRAPNDAPVGACILYAQARTLSDSELADRFDLLVRTGGGLFDDFDGEDAPDANDAEDDASDVGHTGKGNKLRLKPWNQRKAASSDRRDVCHFGDQELIIL